MQKQSCFYSSILQKEKSQSTAKAHGKASFNQSQSKTTRGNLWRRSVQKRMADQSQINQTGLGNQRIRSL